MRMAICAWKTGEQRQADCCRMGAAAVQLIGALGNPRTAELQVARYYSAAPTNLDSDTGRAGGNRTACDASTHLRIHASACRRLQQGQDM